MPETPKLVMVGLSNLDQIFKVTQFPPQGSRTPATHYAQGGGGPAATAAVTAARLGADTQLWALHGDDQAGAYLLEELSGYGVDVSHVQKLEGAGTWVSAVLVTPEGERFIFPYRDPRLLERASGWNLADLAGTACLLTDVRHPVQTEPVLKRAKEHNIPIVADYSSAQNLHLAAYSDFLIVSEECALEVAGSLEPHLSLPRLRQYAGQVVGVTLGERGFYYSSGEELRHVPAFEVEVVDTTGAGDVFHGAYAYGVACGWNLERCARFASATAALKCSALGGRAGIPTLEEVLEFLERHP